MVVKSKVKAKKTKTGRSKASKAQVVKAKAAKKVIAKSKPRTKAKPAKKFVARSKAPIGAKAKTKVPAKLMTKPAVARPVARTSIRLPSRAAATLALRPATILIKRAVNPLIERRPVSPRSPRVHQFAYMKAPGLEHAFEVGDTVEVFCDHEKNRERVRGWVRGIVVQVDNKMVAVQFRSNVFLTDGWMVPDRILWYPVNSEHIRAVPGKKVVRKDFIPDY